MVRPRPDNCRPSGRLNTDGPTAAAPGESSDEGREGGGRGRWADDMLPPGLPATWPPKLVLLLMLPVLRRLPLDAVEPRESTLLQSCDVPDCTGPNELLRCGSVVDCR